MKLLFCTMILMQGFFLQAQKTKPDFNQFFPIERSHSYVEFSIKYMGAAKVRGRFADFSGIIFYDEKSLASTSVSVTIKTASINTDLEFRDNDLRSANWFDAAKYPAILFQSKSAVKTATGFDITGDITIKGVMKEIVLHMEPPSPVMKDVRADIQVVFTGTTRLDRTIFGVEGKNWSAVKEGITAVDNEVTIEVSMLGKQAQRANYTNRFKDPEQPTGKMYKVILEQGVDAGIADFDKMKATTTDAGTLDTVGKMLRLEGKTTEAMRVFEHNRQLFPDSPLVYMSLGETYIIMGNVALAREQFTQVLVKDPLNVISREYLRHLE
jgi:polyisoprenoid-binding protein YceI